jgi:cell division protein FtsI (penicillin-binding protein 3)
MDFKPSILLRARIAFLVVLLFAFAILGKLVHIQFVQGKQWQKSAQVATLEFRPIKPTRGQIYAADGSLLATSLLFYRVAFDPCMADEALFQGNIEALAKHLASFYQDKPAEFYQILLQEARRSKKRYILLHPKEITHQHKVLMSQWPIFNAGRSRGGVIFEKIQKRFKPFQDLAGRTIGFTNEAGKGVGIEYSFDQLLRGIEGRALYQKMAGGDWKIVYKNATLKPVDGCDLETTIDINLQDVAHTSLLKILKESQANYGCVIVMEVSTGEIKAMVNLGKTNQGNYKEIYNYAVGPQGNTEPGSSFKLVSMLALLEETSMALTDTVDTGNGACQFHNLTMHDVKSGGYGVITLQDVFEQSSNIGLAKLVDSTFSHQPQKFISYIRKLKLDKPLDFQLTGEGAPFIKNPKGKDWTGVTLPWMSIGYELKLTPLHILTVYNAVANKGKMLKPILVKRIKQANRTMQEFKSTVLNPKICSDKTLQKLHTMLEGVVERGTASRFRHSYYRIAAKSGTSNKLVKGRYTNATYASFVGYFPADAPRYSCIVVIDDPKGVSYHFGGQVAAPVIKDIADKLSGQGLLANEYINIQAKKEQTEFPAMRPGLKQDLISLCQALGFPHDEAMPSNDWGKLHKRGDALVWQPAYSFSDQQVPQVVGMSLKDALFLLENRRLQVSIQGYQSGTVRTQSLAPGSKIVPGQVINLTLG